MQIVGNPAFEVHCYICGVPGYHLRAHESWMGASFRCKHGCHPANVASYQAKLAAQREASRERMERMENAERFKKLAYLGTK